jgi:hypothetical protein
LITIENAISIALAPVMTECPYALYKIIAMPPADGYRLDTFI